MANYKNIELDEHLLGVIRHMYSVEEYREILRSLEAVWDNLGLLGQLSGTGTDIADTRHAFHRLSNQLLNQLAGEALKKAEAGICAKAQVAIDILVRNLYERTADIAFLATDVEICRFVEAAPEQRAGSGERLRRRFGEYVAKYSVYSDVILLAPDGAVLCRLEDGDGLTHTRSAPFADALKSGAAYVESFGAFDLQPGAAPALIYSRRIDAGAGSVLCLCFRFRNEMEQIFAQLALPGDRSVTLLLDARGEVIASSDRFHIPLGARLPVGAGAASQLIEFGGNEYLLAICGTQGYQGYAGPGWLGAVMLPLQYAFNPNAARKAPAIAADVLQAVTHSTMLFSEVLRGIPPQAERIQRDLNRAVWNGNVRFGSAADAGSGNTAFAKVLLWEISKTGARTKEVFGSSIANLQQTVVSSILDDCRFRASLATNLMDRNLYERANDCRWWARSGDFTEALADGAPDLDAAVRIAGALAYINGVYTVYANLLVFDAQGTVVAVSDRRHDELVGSSIDAGLWQPLMQRNDPQAYAVTAFAPSALYDGAPTYTFAAVIQGAQGRAAGGIAIVFDATPQFGDMLRDVLPRDVAGAFAVFADRDGMVIACSGYSLLPGARLPAGVDAGAADGWYGIVCLEDVFYAAGVSRASGYREYRNERDDVAAFVFLPLCEARARTSGATVPTLALVSDRPGTSELVDLATFRLGTLWYALRATDAVEALEEKNLVPIAGGKPGLAGYQLRGEHLLPVFDLDPGRTGATPPGMRQVIVARAPDGALFGILADDLGGSPSVAATRLKALPAQMQAAPGLMIEAVVTADPGHDSGLLQVLDVVGIAAWLKGACPEDVVS